MKVPFFKNLKFLWNDVREMWSGRPARTYSDFYDSVLSDLRMFARSPHYDAGKTGRLQDDWTTSADTPSANFKTSWRVIIARSIDAVANNPHGTSLLNTLVSNVIGQGLRPVAMVKMSNGGPVTGINKILNDGWERYSDQWDSTGKNCHAEMQRIRFAEIFKGGSILTNLRPSPAGSFLSISNQSVNVLRLDESHDDILPQFQHPRDESKTVFGINFDADNRELSYWIQGLDDPVSANFMRLDYRTNMAEQLIGEPWMIPALAYLWANKNLIRDKLIASRLQAMIGLFVPYDTMTGIVGQQKNSKDQIEMTPGRIYTGKKGEKPEVVQADDSIKDVLDPLQRLLLHAVATTQGVSYQTTTRDLVKTNMASARVNVNEDKKAYRAIQKYFIKQPLQRDWNIYVKYMFMEGKISGLTFTDYLKDPWKYSRVHWIAPGFDMVDPAKEGLAAIQLRNNRMLTLEKWFGDQGKDWRAQVDQMAIENEYLKKKGLDYIITEPEDSELVPVEDDDENE